MGSFKSFIICNACYAVPGLQIPDYYPLQKTQLHFSTSQHCEDQPTPGTPGKYQQLRSHTELPTFVQTFTNCHNPNSTPTSTQPNL